MMFIGIKGCIPPGRSWETELYKPQFVFFFPSCSRVIYGATGASLWGAIATCGHTLWRKWLGVRGQLLALDFARFKGTESY